MERNFWIGASVCAVAAYAIYMTLRVRNAERLLREAQDKVLQLRRRCKCNRSKRHSCKKNRWDRNSGDKCNQRARTCRHNCQRVE
ncbi:hypothetical protein GPALN_013185 [Globodera pallida]|nr:hypothetical protein GPALN_013185 [Globodera pallida]